MRFVHLMKDEAGNILGTMKDYNEARSVVGVLGKIVTIIQFQDEKEYKLYLRNKQDALIQELDRSRSVKDLRVSSEFVAKDRASIGDEGG